MAGLCLAGSSTKEKAKKNTMKVYRGNHGVSVHGRYKGSCLQIDSGRSASCLSSFNSSIVNSRPRRLHFDEGGMF